MRRDIQTHPPALCQLISVTADDSVVCSMARALTRTWVAGCVMSSCQVGDVVLCLLSLFSCSMKLSSFDVPVSVHVTLTLQSRRLGCLKAGVHIYMIV